MGKVIRIAHYFVSRGDLSKTARGLFQLAMCSLYGNHKKTLRQNVERALLAAILDPNLEIKDIKTFQITRTQRLRIELQSHESQQKYDDAAQISLSRLKMEREIDLLDIPFVAPYQKNGDEDFLIVRDTLGFVALAWQVIVHPAAIALTVEDLNRLESL